jgi:hypothetical protein
MNDGIFHVALAIPKLCKYHYIQLVIELAMNGVGVEIHLAWVKHAVMELLEKDGIDPIIGRDHIHAKVVEAVQLFALKEARK